MVILMTVTSKSGDVGLVSTASNVNVTAAKDVDLNATKAIKFDGDTAVTVTSKSGDAGLVSTASNVNVTAAKDKDQRNEGHQA